MSSTRRPWLTAVALFALVLILPSTVLAADPISVAPELISQIFGPLGAIAVLLAICIIGGRILWWFVQDMAKQRDLAQVGWREQMAATNAVAEAVKERNRLEAERMKQEEFEERTREEAKREAQAGQPKRRASAL